MVLEMNRSRINYFAFTYRFYFRKRTGELRVLEGTNT